MKLKIKRTDEIDPNKYTSADLRLGSLILRQISPNNTPGDKTFYGNVVVDVNDPVMGKLLVELNLANEECSDLGFVN